MFLNEFEGFFRSFFCILAGVDGNTIDSEEQSDEEYGGTGAALAATSMSANSKQQMFAWTKGRGPEILEKLRQTGGQGIEKIKQTGGEGIEKIKQSGVVEKIKQTGVVEKIKPTFLKQLSNPQKETTVMFEDDRGT